MRCAKGVCVHAGAYVPQVGVRLVFAVFVVICPSLVASVYARVIGCYCAAVVPDTPEGACTSVHDTTAENAPVASNQPAGPGKGVAAPHGVAAVLEKHISRV